jgi:hypothetical protein
LGAQRKLKEAVQELASLSALGVTPDTRAATALVAACAQAGNMDMAEAAFEQLFGREGGLLEPDEVAFAVLVRGYGALRPGPQWGGIDATLTRMRARYGLEPTAGAFWGAGAEGLCCVAVVLLLFGGALKHASQHYPPAPSQKQKHHKSRVQRAARGVRGRRRRRPRARRD